MITLVLIVHVLVAAAAIVLILLHQGKGADAGASFGAGASNTVFGSQGAGSFLDRMTAVLITIFFLTSFSLSVFANHSAKSKESVGVPQAIPAVSEKAPTKDAKESVQPKQNDAPQIDVQTNDQQNDAPQVVPPAATQSKKQ